jgi:hypothetical protein
VAVNRALVQNIAGKLQNCIPQGTRALHPTAGVIADLPIKSTEGNLEPRICERMIEDRLTLGIESDSG